MLVIGRSMLNMVKNNICELNSSRLSPNKIKYSLQCLNNQSKNPTLCIQRKCSSYQTNDIGDVQEDKLAVSGSNYEPKSLEELQKFLQVKQSPLDILKSNEELQDYDDIGPELRSTFNLAAHVNKSKPMQELLKLGVSLGKFDTNLKIASMILTVTLDEVQRTVKFLHNLNIAANKLGHILTIAPELLKEDLDVLENKIEYLRIKNFTSVAIADIIASRPDWLLFSISEVDSILGYYQKKFLLSGSEVRHLATKFPTTVTKFNKLRCEENHISLTSSYEYSAEEVKSLLLSCAKVFFDHPENVKRKLHLLHDKMQLPHSLVVQFSCILNSRVFRIDDRHYFLKSLGRDQYDPNLPNYISLLHLSLMSDEQFATDLAKSSVAAYHQYMLTT